MCPQRRPVHRSRETLTCAPGEQRGGAGGGAELEAAHLAGQVSPARARGGANQGGTSVERPPSRGYSRAGEGPVAGSSGATLPLPGCAGRARPGSGLSGRLGWVGRLGVRGPGSPLGWLWLEVGAVLAGEEGAGGERGPCTARGAVSTAGSSRGRRAPAAGEGGACPEGTAGVGAVLARAAEPGSGSPLPPGLGARGGGNRGAETLGPEIKGAQMPRHASRRLFW